MWNTDNFRLQGAHLMLFETLVLLLKSVRTLLTQLCYGTVIFKT
jgi:hypothetical protein